MQRIKTLPFAAAAVATALCGAPVLATNGYFSHGFGAISKSMAGAGTAMVVDTMAAATNPATMAWLGPRLDLGVSLFSPDRGYTADTIPAAVCGGAVPPCVPGTEPITAGTVTSDNTLFPIPHFGISWPRGERTTLALTVGGNGGLNTEYDRPVFANFGPRDETGMPIPGTPFSATAPTGVDLSQVFFGFTYARRVGERHAFGITPLLLLQSFEATGLEPFRAVSVDPDHVTNNGHEQIFGAGVRVGWLSRLSDRFSLGVSYQTRTWCEDFSEYAGLFADGGNFDVPPIVNAGIAVKPHPALTLAVDVQHIFFSEVDAVSNANDKPLDPLAPMLGAPDGLGFGWDDMTVLKLGAQWEVNPRWTLRAGYSVGDQPVPGAQALFNILAPAVIEEHATVGFSRRFGKNQLNLFYMHAFEGEVDGTNPNTGPQTGSLRMDQDELGVSWTRFF